MALKFKSKPKRITRELARELARKAIAYYKDNKDEGSIMRVFLEYEKDNPNKYCIIVDKERGRRNIPEEIFRNGLVYLPTSEEYNNSKNKPTQKKLEDLIYYKGNQQLSQLHKTHLKLEFLEKYVRPWAMHGGEQPKVPVQILYVENSTESGLGEVDDIYTGALSDDMFIIFDQWVQSIQEIPEYEGKSLNYISDDGVRNEIYDGAREFNIGNIYGVGDIVIKVGVNKYGGLINLNNYIY